MTELCERAEVLAVPSSPRWKLAEDCADKLTKNFSAPPIPVLEIAEQNGVNVVFANFGENAEKVAGFCDFRGARLFINRDDIPTRQAFTMAHELGHWIMHREFFLQNPERYPVLPRFNNPDRSNIFEKEANCFAACLLVPKRLLVPVQSASVSALAQVFGVSRTMMEHRVSSVRR